MPLVPPLICKVSPEAVWSVPASDPVSVKREVEVDKHVVQPISPSADRVIGDEAETATVPEALGMLIDFDDDVGSTGVNVVVIRSAVAPSKIKAPAVLPIENLVAPLADAVNIFWSPVSSKITRAFPVTFP